MRRGTRTTLDVDAGPLGLLAHDHAGRPVADTVYVAINRSDSDRTTTALPAGLTELLTNTPAPGPSTIPARQTRIFK